MTGILELPGIGTLHTLVPGLEFTVVDSRVLSDEPLNGEVSGKLTIDTAELDVFLSWPSRSYKITPRRREPGVAARAAAGGVRTRWHLRR